MRYATPNYSKKQTLIKQLRPRTVQRAKRGHTVELNRQVVINIFGVLSRFNTELNSSQSFPANSYKYTSKSTRKPKTTSTNTTQVIISRSSENRDRGTSSSSGRQTVSSNSLVFSIVRGMLFGGGCSESNQIRESRASTQHQARERAILESKDNWRIRVKGKSPDLLAELERALLGGVAILELLALLELLLLPQLGVDGRPPLLVLYHRRQYLLLLLRLRRRPLPSLLAIASIFSLAFVVLLPLPSHGFLRLVRASARRLLLLLLLPPALVDRRRRRAAEANGKRLQVRLARVYGEPKRAGSCIGADRNEPVFLRI